MASCFLYPDGSYSYLADPTLHTPPRNGALESFGFSVSDGHDTTPSTLSITVFPAITFAVIPIEIGYPIWNVDGTGFEVLTQGNRSDPYVFINDQDGSVTYDQKHSSLTGYHQENDHLAGTHYQWAYDFAPVGSKNPSVNVAVHSVSNGTVVFVQDSLVGNFGGYGNVVTILSNDASGKAYYVTYAHLRPNDTNTAQLHAGDTVSIGQVIGDLGSSGTFDGSVSHPHLHIQFGSAAYDALLVTKGYQSGYTNLSSPAIVADGQYDTTTAPAYFPELTMDYRDVNNINDRQFVGTQGKDIFYANSLGDTIYGAGEGDELHAGAGADTFIYKSVADSRPGTGNFDTVIGFAHDSDQFDFSKLIQSAKELSVITFDKLPSVLAPHTVDIVVSGSDTSVYVNLSGILETLPAADMEIHVQNVNNLSAHDFILH